ncbi:LysR family transcriptional regulator [Maridesulfovibrio salexigens]|uniref:Transcriptional regulator, LysR family n=1 Tax=Maridesulfovibrio salexigens (strain ATCC 14822 / DSM 2638 / NCIMB 8403 / VKM B-1763) TaxID=526222 RepID=C6BS33_MARSD|nr:LysR family transcriptional regulator [Maridesulfovibrio salexigens]ACS81416.1 transcriptional regulator, LysR family [Maridesulfovibrio salexigens DSM 2638]
MRFSIEHIEAFVTVVDTGSFSAAARSLGKVQSQISTAIANLEDDLGITLFDRSGKYPQITQKGEELLFKSRKLLRQSEKLIKHADRLALGEQTLLRLALDEYMPLHITTQVLNSFQERFPTIDLEVLWGAVGNVQKNVSSGQADVGIDVPVDNIASSGLSFKKLSLMEFCAVAAPNHPLADMKALTKETLQSYRQAMGMSQHGSRLPDSFKKSDQVWLFEDSRLIHRLVLAGTVWAGLPRNMVAEDLLSGKLVELPIKLAENELKGIFYYVWNVAHELTPAEQWLCENFGKKLRDAIS